MAKPEKHVFVCSQNRPAGHPRGCCAQKGGNDLIQAFWKQAELATANVCREMRVRAPLAKRHLSGTVYGNLKTGPHGAPLITSNTIAKPARRRRGWRRMHGPQSP